MLILENIKLINYDIDTLIRKSKYAAIIFECNNNDEFNNVENNNVNSSTLELKFYNAYSPEVLKNVFIIIQKNNDVKNISTNEFISLLKNEIACRNLMKYLLYEDLEKYELNVLSHMKELLCNILTMKLNVTKDNYNLYNSIISSQYFSKCDTIDIFGQNNVSYDNILQFKKITNATYNIFKKK